MQSKIVIFSGFNQRAVIAFLRTLEKNNIEYAIIAASEKDTIFSTAYKNKVYAIRKQIQLDTNDLLDALAAVKERTRYENLFIVPSTEALNRFLLQHRNLFEEKGIIIPLVKKALYEQISDKYSFGKLCKEYSICVPHEEKTVDKINLPFVAKPYFYFNKDGKAFYPQLIYSEEEKKSFLEHFDSRDFFYQQYIFGRSFYLLYYVDKNRNIYKYSQENIAQQPNGKSIVAAISSSVHLESVSDKYEQMLCALKFRGLIMIEIKEKAGEFFMIEANPRFWGPSQLFVDAQMNFFEAFLYDYEFINQPPDFSSPAFSKYLWLGGIEEVRNKNLSIVYHSSQYKINEENLREWKNYDIYERNDTMQLFKNEIQMTEKDKLIALYAKNSKHSNYQIMPSCLAALLGENEIAVRTRYERERLNYMLKNIDVKGKNLLDIGGNTGFFSFEMIDAGAKHVLYYEGNKVHSDFVQLAVNVLELNKKINVINDYFSFTGHSIEGYFDIVLLLNVLHHVGDDYGSMQLSIQNAKSEIIKQLNSLADKTEMLVFQLGFCWKGDRNKLLFENGTKEEMINFIKEGISSHWNIEKIGIPVKVSDKIEYEDMDDKNMIRDDSLGEFLNRPLFILKSKKWNV
ncbi:MAG: hypothetical protein FWF53_05335 [Candidatus Azobacteroides sp.]|nr:hypothetical protein [Candidatus Azobacteroides sp.]